MSIWAIAPTAVSGSAHNRPFPMILTQGDKCLRTPAYWAFDMVRNHRGATALAFEQSTPAISISASRKDREVNVTLVNSSVT